MRLEFEITEDEYRDACSATRSSRPDWYKPLRIAGVIGAGVGFALLFASDPHHWLAPTFLVLLGLFLPIYPLLGRRNVIDEGWKAYSTLGPVIWEFSVEGVHFESALSTAQYSWYAFKSFSETTRVFLLYRSPHMPHVISKRAFADAGQESEFRALLQTMLTRTEGAFPVKKL